MTSYRCFAAATLELSQPDDEERKARALAAATSELERLFRKEDFRRMQVAIFLTKRYLSIERSILNVFRSALSWLLSRNIYLFFFCVIGTRAIQSWVHHSKIGARSVHCGSGESSYMHASRPFFPPPNCIVFG